MNLNIYLQTVFSELGSLYIMYAMSYISGIILQKSVFTPGRDGMILI